MSYQQAPGSINAGIFRNVQIDLTCPKGCMLEKKSIKHDSLTLMGASTPPTETMYVYAQKDMIPNDL